MKPVAILCVVLLIAACEALPEDIVQTQYGPVRGVVRQGFRQFQGVPYATPPLGNLRYKVCMTLCTSRCSLKLQDNSSLRRFAPTHNPSLALQHHDPDLR